MDGGAWWASVDGVARSRTRLSDFTFSFHFHALEEEMATHSSILVIKVSLESISEKAMAPHSSTLAWKIPWTEEPGRLQSMGSLRVGHD